MKIDVTNLFDDFIKYQVDIESIAAACKQTKLDTYMYVLVAIAAYFLQVEISDDIQENKKAIESKPILLEFEKALAYHICKINNTLS